MSRGIVSSLLSFINLWTTPCIENCLGWLKHVFIIFHFLFIIRIIMQFSATFVCAHRIKNKRSIQLANCLWSNQPIIGQCTHYQSKSFISLVWEDAARSDWTIGRSYRLRSAATLTSHKSNYVGSNQILNEIKHHSVQLTLFALFNSYCKCIQLENHSSNKKIQTLKH